MNDEKTVEEFDCPRMEGRTQFGKAHWDKNGEWRDCSHCGSMHPDDVIRAIKELGSGIVGGSSKGYKRYIDLPGVKNAADGPIKFYFQHFTENQINEYNALLVSK